MTAEAKLGKGGEGHIMGIQEEINAQVNKPDEPDEGWWAAVLADEPKCEEQAEWVEPVLKTPPNTNSISSPSSSVNWDKIRKIYSNDEIVSLNVVGYNRGGVLVAGEDIHGFVPASHLIDLPSDLSIDERDHYLTSYLDRKIVLKVIECEPENERIVFSERAGLAEEGQRKNLLQTLNEGDIVSGVVTNVTSFGVFVDLGGLEGLIHVSELSWGRVQHPSEILGLDQKVQAQVLQVSKSQGRIALSLKQLKENPWKDLSENLSPGGVVDAEISSIVKYGAFARLKEGVEGLIHISSMNFPNGCTRMDDFLYEGQPIKVCILNIDTQKRRLGLKLESYRSE